MLRLYSWNVNGLRAAARKGFLDWLRAERPDILCIQETKARPEQLPTALREPEGYEVHFYSAEKKGYSGTALYTQHPPLRVERGLGIELYDSEGRVLQADYGPFVLLNAYFPNAQARDRRLGFKLEFNRALLERVNRLREQGREVVLCGDFNAAHTPLDLEHPDRNEEHPGYFPEERAWVSEALATGLRDVFRERHPGEKGHYTWWSYRTRARERNVGWRIDYFLLTPALAERVLDVRHLTEVMGSDHCPVRLDLDVEL